MKLRTRETKLSTSKLGLGSTDTDYIRMQFSRCIYYQNITTDIDSLTPELKGQGERRREEEGGGRGEQKRTEGEGGGRGKREGEREREEAEREGKKGGGGRGTNGEENACMCAGHQSTPRPTQVHFLIAIILHCVLRYVPLSQNPISFSK